jgi:hypothetical protein
MLRQDLPGVLPCVWMSAGLVAFKLCDREGECEGCPFDRAMREPQGRPVRHRRPPTPPHGPDRRPPVPPGGAPAAPPL